MNKTEIIARLNELSGLLGRDIDTTGNTTELELRLRETEQEYAEISKPTPEETIVIRLKEISALTGRDIDLGGSLAELEARLQAEEELSRLNDKSGDDISGSGGASGGGDNTQLSDKASLWVAMTPLCTLHVRGRDVVTKRRVDIVVAGRTVEVPATDAPFWLASGKMKPV